ncbi:MAG: LicD family protein [Clostridiales bacterium]|nr:LicD family protein [Clostridiales bacterium]
MKNYSKEMTQINTDSDNNELLSRLWDTEQEILDVIDAFCRENGLRYSLAYGTLLGAVRHGGFIPWDDDVDIMMPRDDYDKFKMLWKQKAPHGFMLQDEDVEDGYINNFMKIRKDHTTYLQFEYERWIPLHKGMFVDIFPGDRQAPGGFARKLQQSEFLLSLLYNRGYTGNKKGISALCERCLLNLVPKRMHRKLSVWLGKKSRRWNDKTSNALIFPVTARSCKKTYRADLFDDVRRIEFRGKQYYATRDTDSYLKTAYGDYLMLPPENERIWTHHPIIIDFSRNYDELSEEEKWPDKDKPDQVKA